MTTTQQQHLRQSTRRNGRYSKMLRCALCQTVIFGELYTHTTDEGLGEAAVKAGLPRVSIVCHACATKLHQLL